MRLLVTGAGGMLGTRRRGRRARARGHECVGLTRGELDVTRRRRRCEARSPRWRRDASSTAPPGPTSTAPRTAEAAALAVNGAGAGNLAARGERGRRPAVHVSTDYVFDGTAARPYVESDATGAAVAPTAARSSPASRP